MPRNFGLPKLSDLKMNPDRIAEINTRRIAFFLLFLVMFLLTEIGRKIYRPYIYSNHIFDFWIADTMGNFTGTIAIVFFEMAIMNPTKLAGRYLIPLIVSGLILYELTQFFLPGRNTCDWRDIIATLLAGLVSLGISGWLFHRFPDEGSAPVT